MRSMPKIPAPVTRSTPPILGMLVPRTVYSAFAMASVPFFNSPRSDFDRLDDLRVPRAATDVAGHRLFDLLQSRILRAVEQRLDGQDEAGRAVTALNRAGIDKCLLHRVQLVPLRQSFHRDDLRVGGVRGQHHARIHRLAVE